MIPKWSFQIVVFMTAILSLCKGDVCTGDLCTRDWYGPQAYSAYLYRDDIYKDNPNRCRETFPLSRCEMTGFSSNGDGLDKYNGTCNLPTPTCFGMKQSCNDTITCTDLLHLHELLMQGGYNLVCRHGKTFWQQSSLEDNGCQLEGDCTMGNPAGAKRQRRLQPLGEDELYVQAEALRDLGVPIGEVKTSPFERCWKHGDIFAKIISSSTVSSVRDYGILYMHAWQEGVKVHPLLNATSGLTKLDFLNWQALELRQRLGTPPKAGRNNFFITHGFNTKYATGASLDEGYCIMVKPHASHPVGGQQCLIGNKVNFTFASGAHRFDYVARFTPESFQKMKQCRGLQDTIQNDANTPSGYWNADSNGDMEISKSEFQAWLAKKCPKVNEVSKFLDLVFKYIDESEPELLGRKLMGDGKLSLGYFWHMNWGARERVRADGNLVFLWRNIIADDIPDTIAAYAKDHIMENTLIERACAGNFNDESKYSFYLNTSKMTEIWGEDEPYNQWKGYIGEECINERFGGECVLYGLHQNIILSKSIKFKGPLNHYFPIGAPQMRESNNYPGIDNEPMPEPAVFDLDVPYNRKWLQARIAYHMVCDGHVTLDDVMRVGFKTKSKPVCFEKASGVLLAASFWCYVMAILSYCIAMMLPKM